MTTRQLQMFTTEYEEVRFARDMAAYAVVGILEHCIHWLKAGETAIVLQKLQAAKAKYEQADAALTMLDHKKGELNNGNVSAAA